ncbi:MAG: TauD/TfdA dioxygenase family protein [Rhodospirillales bacterium]|jgi:taurine dioxygenase
MDTFDFAEAYTHAPEAVVVPPGRPNTLDAFEVVPTGRAVGAEIRGVDLAKPISEELAEAIRQAWADHLVVLFRDQKLETDNYIDAAQIFGKTQVAANKKYYDDAKKKSLYNIMGEDISILCNLGPDGKPVEKNDGLGSLEVIWHSDNSYIERPPAGSTLYSLVIPNDNSGQTSFNNQYLAYDELPEDLRKAIDGKQAKHDATRNSANVLRPGVTEPTCPEEVPGPFHPMVRIHPVTGKKALYLGRRRTWPSQYIEGMPNDSEDLLDRLWAHATQPKYAWTHEWQVGDFLVWDNQCAMHRREVVNSALPRVMWRSQFTGDDIIPG